MGKNKKKWVDKNAPGTHSFSLVHRSQKDPLAADSEASQFVLKPLEQKNVVDPAEVSSSSVVPGMAASGGPKASAGGSADLGRKEEQVKHGIFFDDEYDYMQHVRERGAADASVIEADPKDVAKVLKQPDRETLTERVPGLQLPAELFASTYEEEVGLLNRAAPVSGPRLDFDPEIIAAMDEDFAFEDAENQLQDDFILQAEDIGSSSGEEEEEKLGGGERAEREVGGISGLGSSVGGYGNYDEEVSSDGPFYSGSEDGGTGDRLGQLEGFPGVRRTYQPGDEETKSRFTEYSMTSSILPRSEALELHDERFEQLYAQYDDDKLGALDFDQEAVEGAENSRDITDFQDVLDGFVPLYYKEKGPPGANSEALGEKEREVARYMVASVAAREEAEEAAGPHRPTDAEIMAMTPYEIKVKPEHDCESILSTRSTLYNHPKIISEPVDPKRRIRLNKRGMPEGAFEKRGAGSNAGARAAAAAEAAGESLGEEEEEKEEEEEEGGVRENKGVRRNKTESAEEKKARKKAIKEERRTRRATKKATKEAFGAEERRQVQIMDNLRRNISGIAL
eukprot:UC1_evm1s1334